MSKNEFDNLIKLSLEFELSWLNTKKVCTHLDQMKKMLELTKIKNRLMG